MGKSQCPSEGTRRGVGAGDEHRNGGAEVARANRGRRRGDDHGGVLLLGLLAWARSYLCARNPAQNRAKKESTPTPQCRTSVPKWSDPKINFV